MVALTVADRTIALIIRRFGGGGGVCFTLRELGSRPVCIGAERRERQLSPAATAGEHRGAANERSIRGGELRGLVCAPGAYDHSTRIEPRRKHYGATRILLKNNALEAKVYDVPVPSK